jgi:hypothetical protein
MGNDMDRPHIPPPHPAVARGFSMPKEPEEHPKVDEDGILDRRPGAWRRFRAWLSRPSGRHDS